MDPDRPSQLLHGKRVVLLFYEASTRTRTSFEFAAKALGAVTTLVTATSSSIEKGESLIDTGWTVDVYKRQVRRNCVNDCASVPRPAGRTVCTAC